jgi:hypothetical protein
MYILHMFETNAFQGMALCFCLATIWLCARIVGRRLGPDRFLLAVLGFISFCEAIRILVEQNALLSRAFNRFVDFVIASLFFLAVGIIRASSAEHQHTKMHLRLVEYDPRLPSGHLEEAGESTVVKSLDQKQPGLESKAL